MQYQYIKGCQHALIMNHFLPCRLQDVLQYAEDLEVDIPMIWLYLAELIGPMVQDGTVPLSFLKEVAKPLIPCNKAGVFVAEILHTAATNIVSGKHPVL